MPPYREDISYGIKPNESKQFLVKIYVTFVVIRNETKWTRHDQYEWHIAEECSVQINFICLASFDVLRQLANLVPLHFPPAANEKDQESCACDWSESPESMHSPTHTNTVLGIQHCGCRSLAPWQVLPLTYMQWTYIWTESIREYNGFGSLKPSSSKSQRRAMFYLAGSRSWRQFSCLTMNHWVLPLGSLRSVDLITGASGVLSSLVLPFSLNSPHTSSVLSLIITHHIRLQGLASKKAISYSYFTPLN